MLSELTRIDRAIEIAAPSERVWQALTDAAEMSAWFQVSIEGRLAVGEEVWMTSTHPGYAGQRFSLTIVEMTPPVRLVWRWHPGEVDPSFDYSSERQTTVAFTLEPTAGGTRLVLAETGFDEISLARRAKVYESNDQGWTEVLGWLRSHVEKKN